MIFVTSKKPATHDNRAHSTECPEPNPCFVLSATAGSFGESTSGTSKDKKKTKIFYSFIAFPQISPISPTDNPRPHSSRRNAVVRHFLVREVRQQLMMALQRLMQTRRGIQARTSARRIHLNGNSRSNSGRWRSSTSCLPYLTLAWVATQWQLVASITASAAGDASSKWNFSPCSFLDNNRRYRPGQPCRRWITGYACSNGRRANRHEG